MPSRRHEAKRPKETDGRLHLHRIIGRLAEIVPVRGVEPVAERLFSRSGAGRTARALSTSPDLPPRAFRWPTFALGLVQVFLHLGFEALAKGPRVLCHPVKCLLRFLGHEGILRRIERDSANRRAKLKQDLRAGKIRADPRYPCRLSSQRRGVRPARRGAENRPGQGRPATHHRPHQPVQDPRRVVRAAANLPRRTP
jgi:hypothetical protein